jgi:hypothetical protein
MKKKEKTIEKRKPQRREEINDENEKLPKKANRRKK